VICDLQLDRLCGPPAMGEAERELARREIRRAALAAVVEGAHVHGGHGFVQLGDPGRRVEIAHAVLARLGPESS
jgi:hypothetical protein